MPYMLNIWLCFYFGDLAIFGVTAKFSSCHFNDFGIRISLRNVALLKFFKLKDRLPDKPSLVISKKEVEAANKEVANALQSATENGHCGCSYNSYTPQQRAKIGKYVAENGPTNAAKHFASVWGIPINESTA